MAKLRKIELMRRLYGTNPDGCTCGECCSFVSGRYHSRVLRKCRRYGLTHSEASDWAKSWMACGLFDKPMKDNEGPVIRTVHGERKADGTMEGQMML